MENKYEKNLKSFFRENGRYAAASFLIPFLILALVYLSIGIYPGSSRSILASDAFSQFSNFHASFRNVLLGKQSIFYTWNASLGLNYLSLISYYLGGSSRHWCSFSKPDDARCTVRSDFA